MDKVNSHPTIDKFCSWRLALVRGNASRNSNKLRVAGKQSSSVGKSKGEMIGALTTKKPAHAYARTSDGITDYPNSILDSSYLFDTSNFMRFCTLLLPHLFLYIPLLISHCLSH